MSARLHWLWLALVPQVNTHLKVRLLQHFGSPERIYAADASAYAAVEGIGQKHANALRDKSLSKAHTIGAACEKLGIDIVAYHDAVYPDRLRNIPDPPLVLYTRGTLPDLDALPGIAVVGTRKASPYGMASTQKLAKELAQAGFVIVSGMAEGIDGEAARGALRAGGKTVAVLGCGVDRCYPAFHQALMGDIMMQGAVISEYPPGTAPLPANFPARNRIISGLSVGVLVIEAPLASGSLITARTALDQGREVYAVPGNLDAPGFAGSNKIMADGEAILVTGAGDIIRAHAAELEKIPREVLSEYQKSGKMRAAAQRKPTSSNGGVLQPAEHRAEKPASKAAEPKPLPEGLTEEERVIVLAVRDGAAATDEIVEKTAFDAAKVNALVTMLELNGLLVRQGGRLCAI